MTHRDHHDGAQPPETGLPEPSRDPAPNGEQDGDRAPDGPPRTARRIPQRLTSSAATFLRRSRSTLAATTGGIGRIPPKMRSAQVGTAVTAVATLGLVLGQAQPEDGHVAVATHTAPLTGPEKPAVVPDSPPKSGTADRQDRIDKWIDEATEVLEERGVPEDAVDEDDLRLIIESESGGDPSAINGWDSNAVNGTPSKGLMQTIDPTFESYALPGHQNIWHPVDNIIAGTLYSIDRYGSVSNVPGVTGTKSGGAYQGY
ncbi:transglycosylase SLT domain-containing protein [Parasphingorhabdus pacifica]